MAVLVSLASQNNGDIYCQYVYDSWGKLVSIKDASGNDKTNDPAFNGTKNPFRYRGYYYDTETGMYYLQSRYYLPEWGRFLNADALLNSGNIGKNLFAYCDNNSINKTDATGFCGLWAQGKSGPCFDGGCKLGLGSPTGKTHTGGNVYVVQPDNKAIGGTLFRGSVVVVDQSTKSKATISTLWGEKPTANYKVSNSYQIKASCIQEDVIKIIKEYDYKNGGSFARSSYSMLKEWHYHNIAANFGIKPGQANDVDFDNYWTTKFTYLFVPDGLIDPCLHL